MTGFEKLKAITMSVSGIPFYILLNLELKGQGLFHVVLTTAILAYYLNYADIVNLLKKYIPKSYVQLVNIEER